MNKDADTINVLLVDDELDFLQANAKALERRGSLVATAASAAEARAALAHRQRYDVAVLDVRLPDVNGYDLFLELRKSYPELQAVMLTGNQDQDRLDNLSQHGLHQYLDKPCDVEQLAGAIKEAFERGRKLRAEEGEERAKIAETPREEPVQVLLIDDEADFVRSLSKILTRRGLVVHQAMSGEEGLKILAQEPIDVAVLDLKMPGMNGLEVLERMKKERPEVEVILLTGHATIESGVEGMKMGAADYLYKPQDPDALVRKIQYTASRREPAAKKRKWWPFGKKE